MAIDTIQFDLSMIDPETGLYLTGNVYTIDGVTNEDDSLRHLSIGQLAMAICLQRAASLETSIVRKMDEMALVSEQLELMTQIENEVLAGTVNLNTSYLTYDGRTMTYKAFLTDIMRMTNVPDTANAGSTDFITALESKMDEKNSFSQQTMIELQSLTNKRDQAYDMVSNILKSLNTVLIGNANNM